HLARDELRLTRAAGALVIGPRELDGRLDRLRAARGEEHPIEIAGGKRRDAGGELDGARVRVAPDGEEIELLDLPGGRLPQLGPTVSGVHAEQRGEPVEVPVARLVPHIGALPANDDRDIARVVDAVAGEMHPRVALRERLEVRGPRRGGG